MKSIKSCQEWMILSYRGVTRENLKLLKNLQSKVLLLNQLHMRMIWFEIRNGLLEVSLTAKSSTPRTQSLWKSLLSKESNRLRVFKTFLLNSIKNKWTKSWLYILRRHRWYLRTIVSIARTLREVKWGHLLLRASKALLMSIKASENVGGPQKYSLSQTNSENIKIVLIALINNSRLFFPRLTD